MFSARLSSERLGSVLLFDELPSTNGFFKSCGDIASFPSGAVVIAQHQTGGRGRLGRSFVSPEGGLYLSYLLHDSALAAGGCELSEITARAAVAVRQAILDAYGIACDIKWVNDLLFLKKKICGILGETVISGDKVCIIIGVGVNVNTSPEYFSAAGLDCAASLFSLTGRKYDIPALAAALINALDRIADGKRSDYLDRYRAACITPGRNVTVTAAGVSRRGKALRINDDFSVTVLFDGGDEENIFFGEISVTPDA